MNRYLLAGCAAVALAMGSGAANAQAKFELKIGGDAYFEAGYVSQDRDAGLRNTEFRNRFRMVVTPTAKADNGLEYGARARFRASNADATLDGDRAFIFAQGGFGRVEAGVTNSFNDNTYVSRPIGYHFLGIYDPVMSWIGPQSGTGVNVAGADIGGNIGGTNTLSAHSLTTNANATKVVYYSPVFAGFQAGVSYTPRNDSFLTNVNRAKATSAFISQGGTARWTNQFQDIFELGANYKGNFSGVTVNASAAYHWGEAKAGATGVGYSDLRAWQVGAQVGYAGFLVGAGYVDHGKSGQQKAVAGVFRDNARVWNVGVQYTTGPIVVGAGYFHGKDPGDLTVQGHRKLTVWNVGAAYTVAPGMTVGLEYNYFDADSDKTNTVTTTYDDKGSVVLLRSIVAF